MEFSKIIEFTKDLNILFVDDDERFSTETLEVLEMFFNKVDLANNGQEGLAKYSNFYSLNHYHYDLIISDITMPLMNGEELVSSIKQINDNQSIVILSASTESSTLINFIKLGVEDFLVKPMSQDSLKECIYKVSKKICDTKSAMSSSMGQSEYAHNFLVPDDQEISIY